MSIGKSKWGNYVGAPEVIDDALTEQSTSQFGNLSRKSIGGVHKLHYIHEYELGDDAAGYSATLAGQVVFTAQNNSLDTNINWTVPTGVTSVSAVCIGGGGGGGGNNGSSGPGASGGGGAQLSYSSSFNVTPGETLTLVIGSGGQGGTQSANPNAGTASSIKRGSTVLLQANGGNNGLSNITSGLGGTGGSGGTGSGYTGGGTGGQGGSARNNGGGAGGGGAGGYSGNGGNENVNGAGGGGCGGEAFNGSSSRNAAQSGGGTGLYGEGTSGSGNTEATKNGSVLGPTSGVGSQTIATAAGFTSFGVAGTFGGGGGAIEDDTSSYGHSGGSGGIRIIWGAARSYPSTNVADV